MMCDFIIASDTAKFGQPEINLGVIAGMGGTQRLARYVGKSKAMDMNLTGRFMDADEALSLGPCQPGRAGQEADGRGDGGRAEDRGEVAAGGHGGQGGGQPRASRRRWHEGLNYERRCFYALFATEDQKEGMAAFAEKREAQFRDK